MAVGVAVNSAAVPLGAVADEVGLRSARFFLPALLAAALICFVTAKAMHAKMAF